MTEKMWLNKIKSFLEEDTININDIDKLLIDIRKLHIERISESLVFQLSNNILLMGLVFISDKIEPKIFHILIELAIINYIRSFFQCYNTVSELDDEQKQIEVKIEEIVNEEDKEFLKKVLQNGKIK